MIPTLQIHAEHKRKVLSGSDSNWSNIFLTLATEFPNFVSSLACPNKDEKNPMRYTVRTLL